MAERNDHPLEAAVKPGLNLKLLPPLFGFSAEDISVGPVPVVLKIKQVIPGSIADETGFSIGDNLQVADWVYDIKQHALFLIVQTTRKNQGYIQQILQLATSIDTEDFL